MSFFRQAGRVAWKDLRVELRSKEIVMTMVFFATLIVLIYSFAFKSSDSRTVREAVPGMLWVSLAFTGTIALGRAFDRERENDTMRALLLAPEKNAIVKADPALLPWLVTGMHGLVLGYATLAPLHRELLGIDPFSEEAIARQARFLRELLRILDGE